MATTLAEIREALAANLAAAFGGDVQTSPYDLETITPPTLQVLMESVDYDVAGARGIDEWTLRIQGFGGPLVSRGAQVVLDGWLDPAGGSCVKAAIEADRSLGGKVQDCVVDEAGSYRRYKFEDGTVLLGCEWKVRVLNRGA